MSSGLAVQLSSSGCRASESVVMSSGNYEYKPTGFSSSRPKLLQAVPAFRPPPKVAHASPHSASEKSSASQSTDVWLCQECDFRPAIVAGCYCLDCVHNYRQCVHCGLVEPKHHRDNRLRRRTPIMRTTYVCLGCANQNMCWNQPVPLSDVSSPRHQPQTVYSAYPPQQTQPMQPMQQPSFWYPSPNSSPVEASS